MTSLSFAEDAKRLLIGFDMSGWIAWRLSLSAQTEND